MRGVREQQYVRRQQYISELNTIQNLKILGIRVISLLWCSTSNFSSYVKLVLTLET